MVFNFMWVFFFFPENELELIIKKKIKRVTYLREKGFSPVFLTKLRGFIAEFLVPLDISLSHPHWNTALMDGCGPA